MDIAGQGTCPGGWYLKVVDVHKSKKTPITFEEDGPSPLRWCKFSWRPARRRTRRLGGAEAKCHDASPALEPELPSAPLGVDVDGDGEMTTADRPSAAI